MSARPLLVDLLFCARRAASVITVAGLAMLAALAVAAAPAVADDVTPTLLVSNLGSITSYPLSATGDAPPTQTTSLPWAGASQGTLDRAGDLWVPEFLNGAIAEYAPSQLGATGTPKVTITVASLPSAVTFDAAGDLWVAEQAGASIAEYTPAQLQQGGAPTPAATITPPDAAGNPRDLAFDSQGNLWVSAGVNSGVILEYTRQELSAVAPAPAVTMSTGGAPAGLTFDAAGDLWVANELPTGTVQEYVPAQLVTGTPTPQISLSLPGYANGASQLAFDAAGDLWLTLQAGPQGDAVAELSPDQLVSSASSITPARMIIGADTGLGEPSGLMIEQAPTVSAISHAAGPAGTQVTIRGTGFVPGSTVEFGAAPAADVTFVSPYELTAIAPAGSGSVDVTVTTGEGTSATGTGDRFAYAPHPQFAPILLTTNFDTSGPPLRAFPLSAQGDAAPIAAIGPDASSTLARPAAIALDGHGDAWIANYQSDTVAEYSQGQLAAGGDPAPVTTLASDGSGSLAAPEALAIDPAGDLWVANSGGSGSLVEFTPRQLAASGAPVPAVTLTLSGGSLGPVRGLAFTATGDLWVAAVGEPSTPGRLLKLTAGELQASGAVTPAVTLATGSLSPAALAFDARGNLWVGMSSHTFGATGAVEELTPQQLATSGAPGAAVTLTADSAGTSLVGPTGLAFDAAGDLWVSDGGIGAAAVEEFTPTQLAASGSPTPVDITGARTGISLPTAVAIAQAPAVSSVSPATGAAAGGTAVTIDGTGFYPGSVVDFGSSPASDVTFVSPYELTAVAPPASGSVDVTVTTGYGTSAASAADLFASAPAPSPPANVPTPPATVPTPPATAPTPPATVPNQPPTVPATTSGMVAPRRSPQRPHIAAVGRTLTGTGNAARITLTCARARCAGTVALTDEIAMTTKVHGRTHVKRERVTLGSVRYRLEPGRRAVVSIRLTATGRRLLARARRGRLTAHLTVTVAGGTALNATVTITRSRPRPRSSSGTR